MKLINLKMTSFSYQTMFNILFLTSILRATGQTNTPTEDKLQIFYDRLKQPDVKYCADKTRLLPDCEVCIPGLRQSTSSSTCDSYVQESIEIRSVIGKLTSDRFGEALRTSFRPLGLYPCKYNFYYCYCFVGSLDFEHVTLHFNQTCIVLKTSLHSMLYFCFLCHFMFCPIICSDDRVIFYLKQEGVNISKGHTFVVVQNMDDDQCEYAF